MSTSDRISGDQDVELLRSQVAEWKHNYQQALAEIAVLTDSLNRCIGATAKESLRYKAALELIAETRYAKFSDPITYASFVRDIARNALESLHV